MRASAAAARIVDHNVLAGTKQQCSQIPYRKLSRLHGKDAGIAFLHDIRSRIPAIERASKETDEFCVIVRNHGYTSTSCEACRPGSGIGRKACSYGAGKRRLYQKMRINLIK
jgi:hypothetical protein